jgi:Ni/Fe-hydrogenase subunit HybB-like protein
MNPAMMEKLRELLPQVTGYIYPNEIEVHWGILIVVYPYITGIVAGAFILASLVKVFNVKEVQPLYRLALLTALAFLLVAPLSLVSHLGHPLRAYEIFLTPQTSSAMAMFGFVYAWYLMVVLLVEIWFDYRKDMIVWAQEETGLMRHIHRVLSLFSRDVSEEALRFDNRALKVITIIGIPSAFLLHGYVGFIFGSIKANPWWSSVLMPIVFLFSAIVSGIALVILLLPLDGGEDRHEVRRQGDVLPLLCRHRRLLPGVRRLHPPDLPERGGDQDPRGTGHEQDFLQPGQLRKLLYFVSLILIQGGIFATRWNVVIGGQMFSKSFRGLTTYKMEFGGIEGLLYALGLLALPLVILAVLLKILPAWKEFTKAPQETQA